MRITPTLALLVGLFATTGVHADKPGAPTRDAAVALRTLIDAEWERTLRDNPLAATYFGDTRYNDRWPDLSLKAIETGAATDRAVLARIEAIDRSLLGPREQLDYDLFKREYALRVERFRFKEHLIPLNPRGGVQTASEIVEQLQFKTAKDYADWVKRLETFAPYVDQTMVLMRQGLRERRTHPKVIMTRISGQLAEQLVADPVKSAFYAPFTSLPDSLPLAERQALQARARKAVAEGVLPALKRFQKFYDNEYLPRCREAIGASALPEGRDYYAFTARFFTTTDLTPDQIHDIGLKEVARLRGEMDQIIRQVGFKGSFQDFLKHLRTDPKFYFTDPQDLFDAYALTAKKIDPELVKLFGVLPRTPYGVRPIPDVIAPHTYTAYYQGAAVDGTRAGYFYVNLYKLDQRPKYEIEALTIHEAVPGHHLQIALANELGEVPQFRRTMDVTAFVEGWALYAESLGEAMGLYQDPYSKFGALTYDMWRAVRLVVDTGMHHKGWSRDEAIRFFRENAAKSEHDIVNEIDRYISWPGQALGYKIGQLKIKELRARAERELGERFDVRGFHDTVLGQGPVPLDVLERTVDAWIAARKADATLTTTPR
jgi:uncharacterized protein (DUF885 family)